MISGKSWLSAFMQVIDNSYKKYNIADWTSSEWTHFLGEVLDEVGKKAEYSVVHLRPDNKAESGEYLNIDALYFADKDYTSDEKEPLVLPRVAVELENSYSSDKIAYCLWKLMCIRTALKVLICYQRNEQKIRDLKARLEAVILDGKLMEGQDVEVLLLIGNEDSHEDTEWNNYYSVFEWKNNGGFKQTKF